LGANVLLNLRVFGTDVQKKVAIAVLDKRKVVFFNNWNVDGVTHEPAKRKKTLFRLPRFVIHEI
jgi:hypothetical protein